VRCTGSRFVCHGDESNSRSSRSPEICT
jgi:hypothetical protein